MERFHTVENAKSYIDLGEKYIDSPWNTIPLAIFAEYKSNGNRINYESRYMTIRKQLSCLVMAEIMEHQGRFIKHYWRTKTTQF